MPKRKFGVVVDKSLKKRTKSFLQSLGYTSFVAHPLIDQLRPADLKIKYARGKRYVNMEFCSLDMEVPHPRLINPEIIKFEYIKCTVTKCNFSFILYVSDKNEWRCFVPTKGNYFCKKKKKAYGYCGCHGEENNEPHPGSFIEEVRKRMQFGGHSTKIWIKFKDTSCRKSEGATTEWIGDDDDDNPQQQISGSLKGNALKRPCPPRCFEKISLVKDLVWEILLFIPPEELYSEFERVCRLWRNIIKNEVFQKSRWEGFSKANKEAEFDIMKNGNSIMDLVFVPGTFKLDLGGIFDSLQYELVNEESVRSYYDLNKAHVILPTLISDFEERKKKYTMEARERSNDRYSYMDYFFPYPLHESLPCPVILRRDLIHKFRGFEEIKKRLNDMHEEKKKKYPGSNSRWFNDDYETVDEAVEQLRTIKNQTDKKLLWKKHTELQSIVTKLYRSKVEYEYFNHRLEGGGSQFETEEQRLKYRNSEDYWENVHVEQKQEKMEKYFEEFHYPTGKNDQKSVKRVKRLESVLERLRVVCKNVMIFRASQLDMEELGHLWILGEYSDQLMIGYTWFICAN